MGNSVQFERTFLIIGIIWTAVILLNCHCIKLKLKDRNRIDNVECVECGYFGSNTDCSKFYRCIEITQMNETQYTKIDFECPPGLIFDKNITSCNREEYVEPKPPCVFHESAIEIPKPVYSNKFVLTGSKYGLVYFKYNNSGSNGNIEEVESVELENVIIDPESLSNYLALTTGLKSLIMRNVQFTSDFQDRVCLLHLEEFYMTQATLIKHPFPQLAPNETRIIEDYRTSKPKFRSLLFFYKDEFNWKIEEISKLKTNIEIELYNFPLFKLNWQEKELKSRLSFSDEIITNWNPNGLPLERLYLKEVNLNLSTDAISGLPTSLKVIDLDHVSYTNGGGDQAQILRKNKGLTSVRLAFRDFTKLHLSDLHKRINYLNIQRGILDKDPNMVLPYPPGSYELQVEFQHLKDVRLHGCQLEETVVRDFSSIFQTNEIFIHFNTNSKTNQNATSQDHSLLKEILKINKLKWIEMKEFSRMPTSSESIDLFNEMEIFLNGTMVGPNDTSFILQKKRGVWT